MNPPAKTAGTLREIAALFLRLGITGFGGPAAHIAMFHDEVVKRRAWLSEDHFLDLLGATNLIPGPNSTEMAIHLGYVRAGWRGLITAGVCFIFPAFLIVLTFAWLYVEYGTTPTAEWLLYGIKPVVIAVVLQALWNLGGKAVKSRLLAAVGVAALAAYLLGAHEILVLFTGGILVMLAQNFRRLRHSSATPIFLAAAAYSHTQLFFSFLKIGAVLYGSGYVLLAFVRNDFVHRLGWLTEQQLLDAVAVGQFTPGPVFTTATFIGYVVGDVPGAVLATVGIFLPSFIFVALSNPLIPRMRRSEWISAVLDGVNVAALGLMAGVTWQLGRAAVVDVYTALLALAAAILLFKFKVNSTWLIIGGGMMGLVYTLVN